MPDLRFFHKITFEELIERPVKQGYPRAVRSLREDVREQIDEDY